MQKVAGGMREFFIKTISCAAILAGFLAVAGPVQAAVFGPVSNSSNDTTTTSSNSFVNTFDIGDVGIVNGVVTGPGATPFTHDFLFTTADPLGNATGGASATDNQLIVSGVNIFDLTNVRYVLFKQGDPDPIDSTPPFVASPGTVILAGLQAATTYIFRVKGEVAAGFSGGNYTGNISLVPLPAAALLFGTALVGLIWWRRRYRAGPLSDIA